MHTYKHEILLQIDTMTFDGDGSSILKFPEIAICNVFTISLKEVRDEVA